MERYRVKKLSWSLPLWLCFSMAIGYIQSFAQAGSIIKGIAGYILINEPDAVRETAVKFVEIATGTYEVYRLVDGMKQDLSDEELQSIQYVNIGGDELFFEMITDPTGGLLTVMREILRLERNALQQLFLYTEAELSTLIQEDQLSAQTTIGGRKYTARMRVRRFSSPSGLHKYVIVDQVTVTPQDLDYSAMIYRLHADVFLRVDNRQLPPIQTTWDYFASGNFRQVFEMSGSAASALYPGVVTAQVIARAMSWNFISSTDQRLGVLEFGNQAILQPPDQPVLGLTAKQNSLLLTIENQQSAVARYLLYRSTAGIDEPVDPPYIEFTGNSYEDVADMQGGKPYFYRVVAVGQNGEKSSPSNEVTGTPLTRYILEAVIQNTDIVVNAVVNVIGSLRTVDMMPVAGASISATIVEGDWTLETSSTDPGGGFLLSFRAPCVPSSYTLRVSMGTDQDGASTTKPFTVSDRPGKGRNLRTAGLSVDSVMQIRGNVLQTSQTVGNLGKIDESATLTHALYDQSGALRLTDIQSLSLPKGSQQVSTYGLTVPYTIPFGNYILQTTISNAQNADELMGNNRTSKTVFVDTIFTSPVFRTREYTVFEDDTAITVDGVVVRLVSHSSTTVQFLVGTESTGSLLPASDESRCWFNSDSTLLLIPKVLSTTDTTMTLTFRAGGRTTQVSWSPRYQIARQGDLGVYRVNGPAGTVFDLNSFAFPFGPDRNTFLGLPSWAERVGGQTNNLTFTVNANATPRYYESYVAWSDQAYRYFTRLALKSVPPRDIAIDGALEIATGERDSIRGDNVTISGNVENRGGYTERAFVELAVRSDTTLVYSDWVEVILPASQSRSFSFLWATLGLPAGTYSIAVSVPLDEDRTSDNSTAGNILLRDPYPLTVAILPFPKVYDVGDSIRIAASVTNDAGTPIANSTVLATITNPDQSVRETPLLYNSATARFEGHTYARLGGNHKVQVVADARRYLTGTTSRVAQCYVNVHLALKFDSTAILQAGTVDLKISNAGDVAGVAYDIVYDRSKLKLDKVLATSFLGENGAIPTSVNFMETGDRAVVGLTRLKAQQWGAVTTSGCVVAIAALTAISAGTSSISLANVGLLASDGVPIAVRPGSGKSFRIIQKQTVLALETRKDSTALATVDTADVFAVNAYNLRAVTADIVYPANAVEVLHVLEDSTLNEHGTAPTLFVRTIDNVAGVATLGITRTGGGDAGVTSYAGPIARIVYRSRQGGEFNFSLANSGLITPYENRTLPHAVISSTVFVDGSAASDTAQVGFVPNPLRVIKDSAFTVAVTIQNVNDLYSFVSDVFYSPSSIRVVGVTEGSFLSAGGSVSTSLNYTVDTVAGSVVLGLTRLGSGVGGAETAAPDTLLVLHCRRKANDSSSIVLMNTGLLKPDGTTRIPFKAGQGVILPPVNFPLQVKVYLQGPFDAGTGAMRTLLNTGGILASRFGVGKAPANAVDSVTIEIRDSLAAATATLRVFSPAWLLASGSVVSFADTTKSHVEFAVPPGPYYAIVRHRNHLPVMSATPVLLGTAGVIHDFTEFQSSAYNNGADGLKLVGAKYAMYAGNGNGDGVVNATDRNAVWRVQNGFINGYYNGDFNLDTYVNATDRNAFWRLNNGTLSQVP